MNTAFFKALTLAAALASPMTTLADHSNEGPDHHAMSGMQHDDHDHGHAHTHEHQDSAQEGHDHGAMKVAATITGGNELR